MSNQDAPQGFEADSPIWYDQPANDWSSAIPIGNGRIGGMIFGGVRSEQILLNEISVWVGPPLPRDNPAGPELIERMRELLFAGRYVEAEAIAKTQFLSKDPGEAGRTYQPLGTLHLEHDLPDAATGYRRCLDLDRAVAATRFTLDGVEYRREAFVSAVDQALTVNLSASAPGKLSLTVWLSRPAGASVKVVGRDGLHLSGQAVDANNQCPGVKFDALLKLSTDGGQVSVEGDRLRVSGADRATLSITAATDYNLQNPAEPLTRSRVDECRRQMTLTGGKLFETRKAEHVADYRRLFERSTLQVVTPANHSLPIDRRISLAASGADDPELLLIYYRYCRYVLISSSRAGNLPPNLQGLWNPLMQPPWASDYHLNINAQEAFWFAEPANLSELHEPFFAFTEGLVRHGRETARVMLGATRGATATFRTDAWMFTTPASFDPSWSMYHVGLAWNASHFMEHYRFTQDRVFLKERALPMLREVCLFFVDWLAKDPESGKLVSGPSASPENIFAVPGGRASVSMGPAHDQEIIWCVMRDYLEACEELKIESDETQEVRSAFEQLALPRIGPDGRLMEWPKAFDETEPGHRHLSHLWGFMPGNRITQEATPALTSAVSKSLDYRLSHRYDAQGWSLGWVGCILARLRQGDRALALMQREYLSQALPNLFVNAHGQVQVTDMMGLPLALIELLLQSHAGVIDLLPALPARWPTGRATGLRARGGFQIDLHWQDNKLLLAKVTCINGSGICAVRYKDKTVELRLRENESTELDSQLQ